MQFKRQLFFLLSLSLASTQPYFLKGQFWASGLTGNDVPSGQSSFESTIGYIPTISFAKQLTNGQLLDFEWAYRLGHSYSGDSLFSNHEKNHRLWVRYSSEKLEARLGLQKIVFGPSQILRTLSWFDTIDLKDPTNQTNGVEAFRLKWYPTNILSIWSWAIQSDQDVLSYGGRTELSSSYGEFGFTFHSDPSKTPQQLGQLGIIVSEPHQRFALDIRHDGFIGSWMESAIITSANFNIRITTFGGDFTLPIFNGILIMKEAMYIENENSDNQSFTALMVMLPLGMIHSVYYISQYNLIEKLSYSYFRWTATYDKFSLNLFLSQSPNRTEYSFSPEHIPKTIAGFGTGIQFMFIYNH